MQNQPQMLVSSTSGTFKTGPSIANGLNLKEKIIHALSSTSSSSMRGGSWEYRLYFNPQADKIEDFKQMEMNHFQICPLTFAYIQPQEKVLRMYLYKKPLCSYQLTSFVFNDQFVIFETNLWFWSIQRNSEGLTLQQSKQIKFVRDKYHRGKYRQVQLNYETATCKQNFRVVISSLEEKGQFFQTYHLLKNNCKDLVKEIFNFLKQ